MPELANFPAIGLRLPEYQPMRGLVDMTPEPTRATDTSAVSAAEGKIAATQSKAALYQTITGILATLPEKLEQSYEAGRKRRLAKELEADYEAAKANPSTGELANFTVSSEGGIKYSPIDADLRRVKLGLTPKLTDFDRRKSELVSQGRVIPSGGASGMRPVELELPAGGAGPTGGALQTNDVPADAAIEGTGEQGGIPGVSESPAGYGPRTDLAKFPAESSAAIPKATPAVGDVVDEATDSIIRTTRSGKTFQQFRGSTAWHEVTPASTVKKPEEGKVFVNAEAALAAGFDPTGARVLPDGTIRVESFKPSGTDIRGKSKITDTQKTALASASVLAKSIDDLMVDYDLMQKNGMAGPIAGRAEKLKQKIGLGSEEGSRVQAEMNTSLFKIARMLNGAGVLTDKDIARAEGVAPTITMGRDQFKGQLTAVKSVIADSLSTWLQTNAGQATDDQVALAKQAIESLKGKAAEPATAASEQGASRENPISVTTAEAYAAAPSGAWVKDSKGRLGKKP